MIGVPIIDLTTRIRAPIERCFDLSRSIDLHLTSTSRTREQAIAGVTSGLIGPGQTVTWRAKHFGIWQTHTSQITEYDRPRHFRDSMIEGTFARFEHDHGFAPDGAHTVMTDHVAFESPLGILGRLANRLVLTAYLERFLEARNAHIKRVAESNDWRGLL